MADSFGARQAPTGGDADLKQGEQVGQPLANLQVAGVDYGGLGPERSSSLWYGLIMACMQSTLGTGDLQPPAGDHDVVARGARGSRLPSRQR
jgi:hypothetical protein